MRIKLQKDEDSQDVELSNENFTSFDWIKIKIGDRSVDVEFSELFAAINAFLIYKREADREINKVEDEEDEEDGFKSF